MSKYMNFKKAWPNPADWETPPCPFCGSETDAHGKLYINVQGSGHDLVECAVCEMRFYSPRLKFDSIVGAGHGVNDAARLQADNYYENGGFYPVPVSEQDARRKSLVGYYRHVFRKVIDVVGVPESVFEIGGGAGFMMEAARQLGASDFGGCELNKWMAIKAKEKFGFSIWYGTFENYYPGPKQWDCLIAMDFIEHSYNPLQAVQKMAAMTKPGGALLIKTFLEELDTERTMAAPVGHPNHFKGAVLRRMLESVGYEIKKWEHEGIMVVLVAVKK